MNLVKRKRIEEWASVLKLVCYFCFFKFVVFELPSAMHLPVTLAAVVFVGLLTFCAAVQRLPAE